MAPRVPSGRSRRCSVPRVRGGSPPGQRSPQPRPSVRACSRWGPTLSPTTGPSPVDRAPPVDNLKVARRQLPRRAVAHRRQHGTGHHGDHRGPAVHRPDRQGARLPVRAVPHPEPHHRHRCQGQRRRRVSTPWRTGTSRPRRPRACWTSCSSPARNQGSASATWPAGHYLRAVHAGAGLQLRADHRAHGRVRQDRREHAQDHDGIQHGGGEDGEGRRQGRAQRHDRR